MYLSLIVYTFVIPGQFMYDVVMASLPGVKVVLKNNPLAHTANSPEAVRSVTKFRDHIMVLMPSLVLSSKIIWRMKDKHKLEWMDSETGLKKTIPTLKTL